MTERPASSGKPMRRNSVMPGVAAACAAGAAIGLADWLLSGYTSGAVSLLWTVCAYAAGSAGMLLAAIPLSRVSRRLTPVWIWCWAWLGLYTVILVNVGLLPRQSFATLPSMALTVLLCLAAGAVTWPLARLALRLQPMADRPRVNAAGGTLLAMSLAVVVFLPLSIARPDLAAHHSPRGPGGMNAVVIVIDTLRADHVSSYGRARGTTPHIDALAERGVRFHNAYSTSSWTIPAVASLFSGLPLSLHHTGGVHTRFMTDETLAETLSSAGAVTAAFSANPLISSMHGFDRGFQTFVSWRDGLVHPLADLSEGTTLGRFLQRRVDGDRLAVDASLAWLDQHREDRFFLYLHLYAPHRPYEPPEPQRSRFVDPTYAGVEYHGAAPGERLPASALKNTLQRYDAEIAYADSLVGEVVDAIGRLGLGATTVVAVTSDHGEAFGEHGRWEHGQSVYAEEARIPLIIAHPRHSGGGVVEDPVSLADLHPTVLSMLGQEGAAAAGETPALDLSEAVRLASAGMAVALPERPVLTELLGEAGSVHPETMEAVVMGRVRLVRSVSAGTRELFDIGRDAMEKAPLENGPLALRLERHLMPGWWTAGTALAGRQISLSDEELDRLRSLGYVR